MATYYWVGGTGNWSDATNHWATASNGAPNAANVPTSADDVVFDASSNVGTGAFTVTLTAIGNCRNFTASGLDGVMTFSPGNFTMQINGNLSIPASNFTSASVIGGFGFPGSGTSTVTTNGVTINHNIQITGTGTVQLVDNLTIASNRTFTLSSGTLNLNNKVLSVGIFSSNNSNVRSIAFGGTGQIYLTATSATICALSNHTNYTVTGTPIFNVTDPSTTGTRTINYGAAAQGGSATTAATFNISAGTDTITFGSSYINNLDLTGFAGTLTNSTLNVVGNYTLSSGVTVGAGGSITTFLATSGTKTITTSGKTLDFPLTFNGAGGTFQFQDALTQGSTRNFNFIAGTVQLKTGVTNTAGSFFTTGTTLKYLRSTLLGTQATLSQASGTITATYLDIQDSIVTGGATFDATDPTNVNAGNNTGWLFAATAFIRTLFARATSNGNFLIPTEMEFNEVNQTNFRVSKNNLSVYANEFIEVPLGTRVILLSNTVNTWTVPSDWDSTNNTIHLIGGGAAGSGFNGTLGRRGGGGGGYTKITNFVATPGQTISYVVGLGGPTAGTTNGNGVLGSNTTFNSAMYVAGGGGRGQANTSIGGVGTNGQGGRGAAGTTVDFPPFFGTAGCGGGGAAGPYGDGGNANTYFGGVGDAGFGGGYFSPFTTSPRAGTGNTGIEIYGYGSGGGGSSGATNFGSGGAGGLFGGGGASGGSSSTLPGWGGSGGDGAIIITYLGTDYTQRISNTGNLLISGTFIESANI